MHEINVLTMYFFSEFPIFSNQQKLDSSKLFSFLSTAMLTVLNTFNLLLDLIEIFLSEILFLIIISTQTLAIGEFKISHSFKQTLLKPIPIS